MVRRIVVNGKFLTAAPTGVHRVAEELITAIDDILEHDPATRSRFEIELFAPRDVKRQLNLKHIRTRTGGVFKWIPWEQIDLPMHAGGRTVLSLCNLGPILTTNAVTMIHDAQVYLSPKSYSWPFRAWYKSIQPLIGWRHRKILTVSAYSQQEIARAGVARADKIIVVHNGVDHMARHTPDAGILGRLGLAAQGYVVGLANVQHHKNIEVLLEAFSDPRLASLKLVLFGKADRAALASLIGRDLPANVVTPGAISDSELAGLYAQALCIAFPSLTEGFGLPPLEAMTLSCPAIVAPCGSLPEVCGDGALYAAPNKPEEWIAGIRKLADNPAERSRLAERGLRQAGRFTWRAAGARLLDILTALEADRKTGKAS